MTVNLGKDRRCAFPSLPATHASVTGLAATIEHVGHNLYMDSFFSYPALFDNLNSKTINCCGLLEQIEKRFQKKFWT
jgi:hypothetical protein